MTSFGNPAQGGVNTSTGPGGQALTPTNLWVPVACKIYGGVTLQISGSQYRTFFLNGPYYFDNTYTNFGVTTVDSFFWQEWLISNPNDGMLMAGNIFIAPIGAQYINSQGQTAVVLSHS